jgi:hypothetical protein
MERTCLSTAQRPETRTIADLENKIRDLIVLRTDADLRMPYEEAARSFELSGIIPACPLKRLMHS